MNVIRDLLPSAHPEEKLFEPPPPRVRDEGTQTDEEGEIRDAYERARGQESGVSSVGAHADSEREIGDEADDDAASDADLAEIMHYEQRGARPRRAARGVQELQEMKEVACAAPSELSLAAAGVAAAGAAGAAAGTIGAAVLCLMMDPGMTGGTSYRMLPVVFGVLLGAIVLGAGAATMIGTGTSDLEHEAELAEEEREYGPAAAAGAAAGEAGDASAGRASSSNGEAPFLCPGPSVVK
eukprot:tig00021257_g19754.t1